jgi:hypothetical protein
MYFREEEKARQNSGAQMADEERLLGLLTELRYPNVGQIASAHAILYPGKLRYQLLEWLFEKFGSEQIYLCLELIFLLGMIRVCLTVPRQDRMDQKMKVILHVL